MNEIRIYVEGGGDKERTKRKLRQGFEQFFSVFRDRAREKKGKLRILPCGTRKKAYKSFRNAIEKNKNDFNILLVDAEKRVNCKPWVHLKQLDKAWTKPKGSKDDQCHMMVTIMESWIIADKAALRDYYKQRFRENHIPTHHNVETINKNTVINSLKTATKNTQKGEYHKIDHASDLLKMIDVNTVRSKALHCKRLFRVLEQQLTP